MRGSLRRTAAMVRKEIYHVLRDPRTLYLALGMPLVMIFLFGYALSLDVERIPLAVIDHDQSPASRRLARTFTAGGAFRLETELPPGADEAAIEDLFQRRRVKVVLVVPEGYARSLQRGERSEVQVLLDGADANTAAIAQGYLRGIGIAANQRVLGQTLGSLPEPPLDPRIRFRFNPALRSPLFIIPGLVAVIMSIMGVLLTGLTVAREWEQGSMEQLFSTPISPREVVVGKLIPYFIVGMLQLLLVLSAGAILFDVPIRGSLPAIFIISAAFLAGMLGQGLFISVTTRSQQLSSQFGVVSSLLPALLLSGFLFPIRNMPTLLQLFSRLVPARYFVAALRGAMLKGNTLRELWPHLLALLLFDLVILGLAISRFKRSLDP